MTTDTDTEAETDAETEAPAPRATRPLPDLAVRVIALKHRTTHAPEVLDRNRTPTWKRPEMVYLYRASDGTPAGTLADMGAQENSTDHLVRLSNQREWPIEDLMKIRVDVETGEVIYP